MDPTDDDHRRKWNGFCEIESDPAFFNVMLSRFGVEGVKVQEIVSLDAEMLALLPRPVYGLIFLFRWVEEASQNQEQSCPEDIWFANQTSDSACASVALLNIVNNIPIELGENLEAFKRFTADFTPVLRGDAISNYEFVKEIHNSFARKTDMLNADLLLKTEAQCKKASRKSSSGETDSTAGYHFIAFMPIKGSLWKFDGLERQPISLGSVTNDWLAQASPDIQARMAQYEESRMEFAILSLVKDPVINLLSDLAGNVLDIRAVQSQLEEIKPDWRSFIYEGITDSKETQPALVTGPDAGLGLTDAHLSKSQAIQDNQFQLPLASAEDGLTKRKKLITAQQDLKMAIQEEVQSRHLEQEKANARSRDFGAKMQKFARKVQAKKVAVV